MFAAQAEFYTILYTISIVMGLHNLTPVLTYFSDATMLSHLGICTIQVCTIFYKGPLQWHNQGPKVAILFAGTTLLNHTLSCSPVFTGIQTSTNLACYKPEHLRCAYMYTLDASWCL